MVKIMGSIQSRESSYEPMRDTERGQTEPAVPNTGVRVMTDNYDDAEIPLFDGSSDEYVDIRNSHRSSDPNNRDAPNSGLAMFTFLTNSLSGGRRNISSATIGSGQSGDSARTLDTLFGVFMPCVLAMFSLVLFLRCGIAIGQCGLYVALVILTVGYLLVLMTSLSICAISTNGEVQAGGAYFMISRTLGPEFGGALGVLLFISQVLSSGTYITSMTEAIVDSFGNESGTLEKFLPESYSFQLLYSTVILILCLVGCGFGGSLYAKSTFIIFIIVNAVIGCVIVNFFLDKPKDIDLPSDSVDFFNQTNARYTGLHTSTYDENKGSHYSSDYTTHDPYSFISVFAIVFNGCTGILAGANLSGELKDPSVSIPKGTLLAQLYTFVVYAVIYILAALTCSKDLLQMNYTFLQPINFYPPIVFVGTILVTMSAALSAMIGGSRVLYAIAKDEVFGIICRPFAVFSTRKGNPYMSVLFTAFLVQLVLFIGNVNLLAPMVSIFFLMVYFFVNLACALLDIASAPNFRPSFRYFSWHISFMGMIGCMTMIFLISPVYAAVNLLILVVLIVLISIIGPSSSWGSISQGLTFYVVRKFLLKLDPRKDHVKFWRPQILLLVNNPKSCVPLLSFVNDLKKSGLYVIGHVFRAKWDDFNYDPIPDKTKHWLTLVDFLQLKAFVEMTISGSIRDGVLSLARLSGLGGMKPNTVILGFFDFSMPMDTLSPLHRTSSNISTHTRTTFMSRSTSVANFTRRRKFKIQNMLNELPEVRNENNLRAISVVEYVSLIQDLICMSKNVCIARDFNNLDFTRLRDKKKGEEVFVDVWLVDFFQPASRFINEVSSLFLLQLACILMMKGIWKSSSKLRVFIPSTDDSRHHIVAAVKNLLVQLRISAEVAHFDWERLAHTHLSNHHSYASKAANAQHQVDTSLSMSTSVEADEESGAVKTSFRHYEEQLPMAYFEDLNEVIRGHSKQTIVSFFYLPKPNVSNVNAKFKQKPKLSNTNTVDEHASTGNENNTTPEKCESASDEELVYNCERYLEPLDALTRNLPPSLLVHGVSAVTCTSF